MTRRLVILGSTVTALAVVRDAHAHGLQPVVVDTQDGIAFLSRWAQACRLPRDASDAHMHARLLELAADGSWLIATGDPWLRRMMPQRAALDEAYEAVLHPSNDALQICLDKHRFAEWCRQHDLSAPLSWWVGSQERPPNLRAPFLIRPAETLHGRNDAGLPKAVQAADEAELAQWLRAFADAECGALVSESLLRSSLTQYSVPFARRDDELMSFVARKVRPLPERCAVGTCVELSPNRDVEDLGRRAALALDYFGVGEAEILHDHATGRNYLIEINARPWLQYPLAPASHHDFLGLLVGAPRGDAVPLQAGRCWIDMRADLFEAFSSSVGAVRNGDISAASYLASLLRVNVFARFALRDPRPAWVGQNP